MPQAPDTVVHVYGEKNDLSWEAYILTAGSKQTLKHEIKKVLSHTDNRQEKKNKIGSCDILQEESQKEVKVREVYWGGGEGGGWEILSRL